MFAWLRKRKAEKKRFAYRQAMMKAIRLASDLEGFSMYVNSPSHAAGLRCIKVFEEVNGITFDPFNSSHVLHVTGMARFGNIVRTNKLIKEKFNK